MTREEAKEFLIDISYKLGNMSIEYLTEKDSEEMREAIKALEQEPCEDAISRNAVIRTLNEMDRYTANELTLCDTDKKFPANEVFIVDDVYEYIAEWLPSVILQPKTGHWIKYGKLYQCSECEELSCCQGKFCNECGAKMVEPQEGSE